VPTVAETLPGFVAVGWQVLVAPAGTPDVIVQKINADLLKVTGAADVRDRLTQFGREEEAMSPAETLAFIQNEQKTWAPVIKQIGGTQ
jgi:tripartite-type tricarboxylate transporter receptor subunit TctC